MRIESVCAGRRAGASRGRERTTTLEEGDVKSAEEMFSSTKHSLISEYRFGNMCRRTEANMSNSEAWTPESDRPCEPAMSQATLC